MREIDRLVEDIRRLQFDDIEKMYQSCLRLKELSIVAKDDYMLCLANNYIIDYYYSCRSQQETINLANEVLALNEEKGYPDLLMQVYNLYAIAVCNNDYSLATGYYLRGLTIAEKLNDHTMMAKFNCNLGDVFINLNRCDLALPYFLKALNQVRMLSSQSPEYQIIRFILCYLVIAYVDQQEMEKAVLLIAENESLFNSPNNDPLDQLWGTLKALIDYSYGQVDKAIGYIDVLLNEDIQGFRANEAIYYICRILLYITYALKDQERTIALHQLLEKNDFGKTGIKNQLEILELKIRYCHVFNQFDRINELYEQYYYLMQKQHKENINFCLNSVLYKIELLKEKKEKQDIVKISRLDELTKIYNRRYFHDKYSEVKNKSRLLGIIIFDLDHFKEHNDNLGHLNGDLILKEFASSLQQDEQRIVACRFGGDEFICVCIDCDETAIIRFIEQVYSTFEEYNHPDITISCGYYNTYSNCLSKEELINNADYYLYFVKKNGKNGYYGYSSE